MKFHTYFTDDHVVSDSPESDKKTLFQFRPIKKGQSNTILMNSKLQLYHVKTGIEISMKFLTRKNHGFQRNQSLNCQRVLKHRKFYLHIQLK